MGCDTASRGVEQSLVFAADIAPIVWHCSIATGRRPVRICDVGAASGAGSNLLWALQNNLHGWPTEMTCFEVKSKYERYAERFRGIAYKVGDVFLDDSPVDVAIASHVIEHVEDPEDFVNRLLGRTGFFVVGYVPFLEREPRCPKHLHSFDDSRIRNMPGFLWGCVMRSSGWRTTEDARVVAFVCAPPAAEQLDLEVLRRRLDEEFETRPVR